MVLWRLDTPLLLKTGERMNGIKNCGRVDQEGGNDWTVKNKSNKKHKCQMKLGQVTSLNCGTNIHSYWGAALTKIYPAVFLSTVFNFH